VETNKMQSSWMCSFMWILFM